MSANTRHIRKLVFWIAPTVDAEADAFLRKKLHVSGLHGINPP